MCPPVILLLGTSHSVTDGLPLQDIGFAGLLGIVVWWLVRRADRDDTNQASEMTRLRTELADVQVRYSEQMSQQQERHAQQLAEESEAWRTEIAKAREWAAEQLEAERQMTAQKSMEKHALGNELAKAEGLVYTVVALSNACTCGALNQVQAVIDRWQADHPPLRRN